MRNLMFALPLALMPLALASADEYAHDHGSLDKHQHGVASLNVALEGAKLEIELESPAMNILGFEYTPSSQSDQATATAARAALQSPLELFALPAAADCAVSEIEVESPLFANDDHEHTHADDKGESHSEIDAAYELTCRQPEALTSLSLAPLFKQFPGMTKVTVQLITANDQKGAELTPAGPLIDF